MIWHTYSPEELKLIVELPKMLEELFIKAAEMNSPFPLATRIAAEEFLGFIKAKGMSLEQMASEGPTEKNLGAVDDFSLRSKASNLDRNGIVAGLGLVGMAIGARQEKTAEMTRMALEMMKPAIIARTPPFLSALAIAERQKKPGEMMAHVKNAPRRTAAQMRRH